MTVPEITRAIASTMNAMLPDHNWAILVFEHEETSKAQYISNSDREGMIEALRLTAEKLEQEPEFKKPEVKFTEE